MKFSQVAIMLLVLISASVGASAQTELKTVPSVDLKRYSGKWFEIARYPNRFQKQCVGNVSATYTQKSNGRIEVLNECLLKNGKINRAKGDAKIVDGSGNSKLKVRFAPAFLSFIPAVWGDYWIIELDPDYKFVVIGEPKREYFWILSRESKMDDATYQGILGRAKTMGFDPAKVVKTEQK
ncbi:MAG: lipocalin family protein [Acidobacteria bacterium]|nr:lipocalin family protein [Acidobacteriota bacterium]